MVASEVIFLLPFVVVRIFRPTFLKVFEISNLELGSAFSVYGITAMASYFLGGPLADRFSPRMLMSTSLVVTAAAGIWMALLPSLAGLTILYGFWGISTILLYWAASIKAIRAFGGPLTQGQSFGLVDGGRGLFAALLASLSVLLLGTMLPEDVTSSTRADLSGALSIIIVGFSALTAATAGLVLVAFPREMGASIQTERITLEGVKNVIKRRSVWLQAFILLCAYVGYKCTDDFSLYASEVFGYNDVDAAHVGTISFWVRPFAALAAGVLGDRNTHSKITIGCFIVIICGSLMLSSGFLQPGVGVISVMTIATTSAGIYGLRGLYYALFQQTDVPLVYTGSAVGFVSVIGYTPDIFMGPLMGYILDSAPGAPGHRQLFALLVGFAAAGLVFSYLFDLHSKKNTSQKV